MKGTYPILISLPYTTPQTRAGLAIATAPHTVIRSARGHYRWTRRKKTYLLVSNSIYCHFSTPDLYFTTSLFQHFTQQLITLFILSHTKSPTSIILLQFHLFFAYPRAYIAYPIVNLTYPIPPNQPNPPVLPVNFKMNPQAILSLPAYPTPLTIIPPK